MALKEEMDPVHQWLLAMVINGSLYVYKQLPFAKAGNGKQSLNISCFANSMGSSEVSWTLMATEANKPLHISG